MKTMVTVKLAIWCVFFIFLLDMGFSMISAPNTIENMIGFFMVILVFYLSIKTKCLTAIKLERKNEK